MTVACLCLTDKAMVENLVVRLEVENNNHSGECCQKYFLYTTLQVFGQLSVIVVTLLYSPAKMEWVFLLCLRITSHFIHFYIQLILFVISLSCI